ncbi:fasciclin domain-containing protein [Hanstruepera marina]|uniref:fasciclin domain-containing protein n=1 Tax=Hanstruepera marina TaxID=2873265 RepID=UPI001CA63CEB|nr:fasciclin domain-containing protein [Hanstruepera marina]
MKTIKFFKTPNFKLINLLSLVFLSLSMIFVSCSTEEYDQNDLNSKDLSIVEVLKTYELQEGSDNRSSKPTFKTLNVALARTGLAGVVSSNRLTVFAPTDEAFAALGLDQRNIASVPNLEEILLYHVLGDIVYSTDLSNGFVSTLNGSAVEVNLDNGVVINDSNVISADVEARNGVIHVIDQVLFPPSNNLLELAESFDPEFSILVDVLELTGLDTVVANNGPYTIFAPTNDAFVALLSELDGYDSLEDFDTPEDIELLTNVLLYHVVEGRVYSSDLMSGPVTNLNGVFDLDVETLTITDNNDRETGLVSDLLNVQATNGVVHVIDRVLLP